MKTLITTASMAVLVVMLAADVQAQGIGLAFKLGINSSTASVSLEDDPNPDLNSKTGINIAAQWVSASASCDSEGGTGLQTASVDASALVGGGIEIGAGPIAVLLEIAYDIGLTNLDTTEDTSDSIKNRTLTFSAGIAVPLGN